MGQWIRDRALRRYVHEIFRRSGIRRRHSVLPDFLSEARPRLFIESSDGSLQEPSTAERNAVFEATYPPLARDAVADAFRQAPWLEPADVTHLITVSCTGFCNPGPDLRILMDCQLRADVERYNLGFMGCYAALPALRMADAFCRANPDATALVVCIELCTLHLQIKPTIDSILANALFADGCAAALISMKKPPESFPAYAINGFASRVLPNSTDAMAWTIGDRGFDMTLSSYVPHVLQQHVRGLLGEWVPAQRLYDPRAQWAIHPGGIAILRSISDQMGWDESTPGLSASYRVLRDFGNMSSATILFVLSDLLHSWDFEPNSPVGALAFGPGLTVEFADLRAVGAPARAALVHSP